MVVESLKSGFAAGFKIAGAGMVVTGCAIVVLLVLSIICSFFRSKE